MAPEAVSQDSFGWLFERSGDPMWLFDPAREVFGLPRDQLLACTPADVSPPMQPDGRSSIEAADIATILGISESTVKKHLLEIFIQLGVETRSAATLRALEALSTPTRKQA